MSDAAALGPCPNHPHVDATQRCASCGVAFCDACIVTFLGEPHCGPCRDRRLAEMQTAAPRSRVDASFAGTGQVDLGRWLTSGWDIIKDDLVMFGLAALLTVLIMSACGLLYGPMVCGIYAMAFRKLLGERVELGHAFDGFKRPVPSLLLSLIVVFVPMLFLLPFYGGLVFPMVFGEAGFAGMLAIWGLVLLLLLAYSFLLPLVTFFVFPMIIARDIGLGEAFARSWEVARRNPFMFLVTGFVFSMISSLGAMACYVGMLITLPWVVGAYAQAYVDHFGLDASELP